MKQTIIILLFLLLQNSCIYNKLRYIQDKNEVFGQINKYDNKAPDYKLKENDILYIKIKSTNKEISELFALTGNNLASSTTRNNNNNFYLQGFTIDKEGCIVLPVIGKLHIEGLNIDQAQEKVQKKLNEYLNNAIVKLKLVSFYVDFLGEIKNEGRLSVMQDNINILEAIAQMGGITNYGNMENVMIVRKTKTGTKTFRIDLTQRNLLNSDKFYLLPYDIVVVEPLKRKSFQLSVRDYSLVLTTITSTITMILLVLNLTR